VNRIVKYLLGVILVLATAVPAFGQSPTTQGPSLRPTRVAKRLWLRFTIKGASANEMAQRLERLYQVEDPWNLQARTEAIRFQTVNELVRRHFPDATTLLELGSGEGLQSEYLLRVAKELHGVDVSPTAVTRAERRVPAARFYSGDFRTRPWKEAIDRFDLVVACEVLYYLPEAEVREAVATLSRLGRGCIVTFVSSAARRVAHALPPHAERSWIQSGDVTWLVAWWRNPDPTDRPPLASGEG
jgi:Nodulation protein S (NodS)